MNPYALIPVTALVGLTFVWSFVLGQRLERSVKRGFLLLGGACAGWSTCELLLYLQPYEGWELFVLRVAGLFWVPLGWLYLAFVYRLLNRPRDIYYHAAAALAVVALLFFSFTDLVVAGVVRHSWGISDRHGPLHTWVALVPAASALFGAGLIALGVRDEANPRARGTYLTLLIGAAPCFVTAAITDVLLPDLWGLSAFPRFGYAAVAAYSIFIAFAIQRYSFLTTTVDRIAEELFRNSHDGIVLVARSGEVLRMNEAARQLLSLPPHAGQSVSVDDLLPLDRLSDGAGDAVRLGDPAKPERVLSVSWSAPTRAHRELDKIILLRDVTEQHRAEALLRRSKEELEEEVARRTEELKHAQKLEALGTVAGGIAHDFNNLLAAIVGFATVARDELGPDHPVRADLDEVLEAAGRGSNMTRQILTFSGREDLGFEPFDFGQVVEAATRQLSPAARKVTTVRRQQGLESATGMGDATAISQLLLNLVTNAFQSLGEGGDITIDVSQAKLDERAASQHDGLQAGSYVCISVADTGCGMDRATLGRIFDPFFTTKPPGKGSGLGLSMAFGIVRKHGGTIEADSKIGEGSTFRIYLPIAEQRARERAIGDEPSTGGQERVLLVDDEELVLRSSRRVLERLGYRVTAVTSPAEALRLLNEDARGYDVLITDQVMPAMTGTQLAREARSLNAELPVVLVSGHLGVASQEDLKGAGVAEFLAKPVPMAQMDKTLRSVLSRG